MTNTIILGDCVDVLTQIDSDSVDLIYLDPPFFTQTIQKLDKYSFDDKWNDILEFKNYIKDRLVECKRVLKDSGSIFLHCDKTASHYLRIALDQVFGYDNFQSEIIWQYKRWSNSKKGLLNSHQVIFFYSKTKDFKFNQKYEPYSLTTNLDQIFQERARDKNGKTGYKKDKNGENILMSSKQGVPLCDVWSIPFLNPKAKERVGYPTQKPILLLERIIELVTDEGDLVLDPFCGSGTTLVASKLLGRCYIGIDKSQDAVQLSKSRINNPIKTESNLLKNGRQSYNNQSEEILKILESKNISPVQRNKGIDGFLRINGEIKPIPVRVQRDFETIEMAKNALIQATKKQNYERIILYVIDFEDQEGTLFESKFNSSNLELLSIY